MDKIIQNTFSEEKVLRLKQAGFSLVELLVVVAIIILLAGASIPATSAILKGSNLNRAGQLLSDQFSLARQEAVTRNRDVEVRFYNITNGLSAGWRGMKTLRIDQTPNGPVTNALSRLVLVPDGVVMTVDNGLSPLITSASAQSESLSSYGTVGYRAVRFRANGSLDTGVTTNNYVTLINSTDTGNPPKNYYTIQINNLTGKTSVFRP